MIEDEIIDTDPFTGRDSNECEGIHIPAIDFNGGWSTGIGVRDGGAGGSCPPPISSSLSTRIRAESRHYSGKTQYMFE